MRCCALPCAVVVEYVGEIVSAAEAEARARRCPESANYFYHLEVLRAPHGMRAAGTRPACTGGRPRCKPLSGVC